jgi:hypothetical protein
MQSVRSSTQSFTVELINRDVHTLGELPNSRLKLLRDEKHQGCTDDRDCTIHHLPQETPRSVEVPSKA